MSPHRSHSAPEAPRRVGVRLAALPLVLATGLLGRPSTSQDEEAVFRRHLEALTAPEMQGRAVGSEGGERAIRYLVEEMDRLRLQPGVDGSFREDFELDDPSPATFLPATRLTVLGEEPHELETGRDAVPFRFSNDGAVEGEAVFAGYGLVIPELEWDDYRGLDVRGKVVLVLRGAPRWRDTDSPFRRHVRELFFCTKARRAAERGAVAMLLCERHGEKGGRERDEDVGLALRASGSADLTALWLTRSAAGRLFEAGERELRRRQERLDNQALREIDDCGRRATGRSVRIVVEMGKRQRLSTSNVIGVLRGDDRIRSRQYVVVGAPHDHLGRGEFGSLASPSEVGEVHPGADDNASGVAGLLALARRLKAGPTPQRSIVFVAFGAEEFGQHGSHAFLRSGRYPPESIVAMVNLDMIGRARTGTFGVQGAGSGKGLQELVEREVRRLDLEVQVRPWSAPRSDHSSFSSKRIPALLFHTGLHDQYHRPTDVVGLVEVRGCLDVVDLAEAIVRRLCEMPDPPEFRRPRRQ